MGDAIVGVVANPLSGRDIRRLVTQATVFPNAEKASMICRMLAAFGAAGAQRELLSTIRRDLGRRVPGLASAGRAIRPGRTWSSWTGRRSGRPPRTR